LTCTDGPTDARMSAMCGAVAPPGANPVEVFTNAAPARSAARQPATISSSDRNPVSRITFTTSPGAAPTTAAMSASTSATRPLRSHPTLSTMSSSTAPSATARWASATFAAVVVVPCGKPITVQTATFVSTAAACATSEGRTHTLNTPSSSATASSVSTCARVSSGLSTAWSIIPATCGAVSAAMAATLPGRTALRPGARGRGAPA